jgi:GTP-binding protein
MLSWLRTYGVTPILVITKCDKVSKNERAKQLARIAGVLGVEKGDLCCFSALSREGTEAVWQRIELLLDAAPGGGGDG